MKTLSVVFSTLFVSILVFTSCQKGNQGIQGATGATGAVGATGTTGATGAAGNTILSGDAAPSDTLGRIGDFYLELDNSTFFGPKTASGWGKGTSLVGQTGAQGDSGVQGPAGPSGADALIDTFSVSTSEWANGGTAFAQFANGEAYTYNAVQVVHYNDIITQGILDSGMVLVSFTSDPSFNANQWLSLPYTIQGVDPTHNVIVNYNWSYLTAVNKVTLQFYLTPTSTSYYPDATNFQVPDARYKVVVISAGVAKQIDAVTNKKFTSQGRVISL